MDSRIDSYEELIAEVKRQKDESPIKITLEQFQKFGLDITESPELRNAVIDDARRTLHKYMFAEDKIFGHRPDTMRITNALRDVVRMASVGGDFITPLQEYAVAVRRHVGGGPMTEKEFLYEFRTSLQVADRMGFRREAEEWFKETRGFVRRVLNLEEEDEIEAPEL